MGPSRLVFHPLPAKTEGFNSFLIRLAEGNGVTRREIIKSLPRSTKFLPELSGLLGVSSTHPEMVALQSRLSEIKKRSRFIWGMKYSKYCPLCVREDPIWQGHWEATLVTACDKHRVCLINSCPVCGKKLTWDRNRLNECQCGGDLRNTEVINAEDEEVYAAKWFRSKLYALNDEPEHIQRLSIHQLHQLIDFLGVYETLKKGEEKPRRMQLDDIATARQIVTRGVNALSDWPKQFNRYLDRLVDRNRQDERSGSLNGCFGRFYNNFSQIFREEEYVTQRKAFSCYLESNWRVPITGRNRQFWEGLRESHRWISAPRMAKELGVSRECLIELRGEEGIDVYAIHSAQGRETIFFNKENLPKIKEVLRDRIDQITLRNMLGLSKRRFYELASHPLLGEVKRPSSQGKRWEISRSMLKEILSLNNGLIVVKEADAPNLVSLGFMLKYFRKRPDLNLLLTAVHRGELKILKLAEGRRGIMAWMFLRSEIEARIHKQ